MKLKRSIAIMGLLGGVGLLAGDALAVTHVFPGMMCQRYSGGSPTITSSGALRNDSSSSHMNVICPIVRPDGTTKIWESQLSVHDQSTEASVSCTLVSRDDFSAAMNTRSDNTSYAGTQLYDDDLHFGTLADYDGGAVFLDCFVPKVQAGTSMIISYWGAF